jgi:hypothetical protein
LRERVLHTSSSLGAIGAGVIRQELMAFPDKNLPEATFEEQADLVARLGSKILASKDLKSSKISCRLNLVRVNDEREQTGFAKVTFVVSWRWGNSNTKYKLLTLSLILYS